MKRFLLSIFTLGIVLTASADTKVYINPGHGSWGSNCRPMATINYAAGDTLGFFESNTNLWKAFSMEEKLKAAGGFNIKLSRRASGGSGTNQYNKALTTICEEATNYGADYYISIHSNAGPDGSDGSFANYPVILYRGYTGDPKVTNSDKMAKKCVARLYDIFYKTPKSPSGGGGPEPTTYYSPSNPRVVGDLSFYNTSSTYGYLGALKHNIPGFLSEGYFHTYSPARHRALNTDWCREEGIRYYRGLMDYYGKSGEKVGYILGYVRSKTEKFSHTHYIPYPGSNDEYKPINGAKIVLRNSADEIVKCNCYPYVKRMLKNQDYYTTDHNYNGIFFFENLAPGQYTLYVHKSGYKDVVKKVTVTADKTLYPEIFMEKGQGTEPDVAPANPDIKWELNGGKVLGGDVPSNEELWESFKPYYNSYYGLSRADQTIENVATFAAAKMQEIMTDDKSEYKWLGDYIQTVAGALDGESAWRWHVHAFFNCNDGTVQGNQKVATADFSQAGKPEAWGTAYQMAMGTSATLPHKVTSTYTLPTPIKDGYTFLGWYDNPYGTGNAITSIPAGWKGTLYAIWQELDPDIIWVLNGGRVTEEVEVNNGSVTIPSNEDLFTEFKADYNAYYSTSINVDAYSIAKGNVANFFYHGKSSLGVDVTKILTDAKSDWKWLGDYLAAHSNEQGFTLDSEVKWRYSLAGFFSCGASTDYSIDFSTIGQPDSWSYTYLVAKGGITTETQVVNLPGRITHSPYTIPTPTKDNDTFVGWYDNNKGNGTAHTVLSVGYKGTIYAIWQSMLSSDLENVIRPVLDKNAPMYDILGRCVDESYRGIIIQNGHKYILR